MQGFRGQKRSDGAAAKASFPIEAHSNVLHSLIPMPVRSLELPHQGCWSDLIHSRHFAFLPDAAVRCPWKILDPQQTPYTGRHVLGRLQYSQSVIRQQALTQSERERERGYPCRKRKGRKKGENRMPECSNWSSSTSTHGPWGLGFLQPEFSSTSGIISNDRNVCSCSCRPDPIVPSPCKVLLLVLHGCMGYQEHTKEGIPQGKNVLN